MDNRSQTWDSFAQGSVPARIAPELERSRPGLSVVASRLTLCQPQEPAPADWSDAISQLPAWLGVDAAFVPSASSHGLARMAGWPAAPRSAPLFAPWLGWAPTAFQHGGLPTLPKAQWAASYLHDHSAGGGLAQRGVDIMLMSPLPAVCAMEEAGGASLPATSTLRAMIGAARAQGRARLAIIVHARQRNAIARQLMMTGRKLTREGLALELLTIENSLRPLAEKAERWDAIIAMPDLRGIVFTLLAEANTVRGPWPMAWHGSGQALLSITGETAGEGLSRTALDAPVLVHSLALALHHAGHRYAARRLHDAWARLRDCGVTTPGRGSSAPYVNTVCDSDFIAMLTGGRAASKRAVPVWRAIGSAEQPDATNRPAALRLVARTSLDSPRQKR
jgi:hypothetical protein